MQGKYYRTQTDKIQQQTTPGGSRNGIQSNDQLRYDHSEAQPKEPTTKDQTVLSELTKSRQSRIAMSVLKNRQQNNQTIQAGSVHKSRRSLAKAVKKSKKDDGDRTQS